MVVAAEPKDRAEKPVSPIERLDQVTIFGTPKLWVGLLGIISLLLAGLAWAIFASPPVTVGARGLISTAGGPLEVGTSLDGTVTQIFVTLGESVQENNTLAIVANDEGNSVRIRTPVAGTVLEISTQVGDFLPSGSTVVTIQDSDQGLESIALIPVSNIGSVKIGQEVLMSPNSVPVSEFGFLRGTVATISSVPMSIARVNQLVGSVAGYTDISAEDEPIVEVRIVITPEENTASGFAWTIGQGPPFALLSGTPWSGDIVTGSQSPIATLFGS